MTRYQSPALRRLPLYMAVLALALSAPALRFGLHGDDFFLQLVLTDPPLVPELTRTPIDLFAFLPDDDELRRRAIDYGVLPWWTHERFRFAFLRPVSGLTHWLDFRLWPERLWLMHLHSLVWLAAAVAAAAVAYRRLLASSWGDQGELWRPAGLTVLAAVLYAVDDAHAAPAVWLANRNAVISGFFALLALVAHDRWRRDGWRPGKAVAPVAFLLGLLAGEIALAAGAYLAAYALFLDRGRWQQRLASLAPAGTVGVAWWIAYRALGYGVVGSGVYIDPGASPLAYARAVVERAPLLLFGQWTGSSSLHTVLSQHAANVLWWVACGFLVVIAGLLVPLLRSQPAARFFALGMVLSALPICATVPNDRLLVLVAFGGMGLLAQFFIGTNKVAPWRPRSFLWRLPATILCVVFAIIHLVLAPISLLTSGLAMKRNQELFGRATATLPADEAVRGRQVLIVNTPTAFFPPMSPLLAVLEGRPVPDRILVLGSGAGIYSTDVERRADDVLSVRPAIGFLAPPGIPLPGHEAEQPALDLRYALSFVDSLYRDDTPMRLGQRIELTGVTVEVTAVTDHGRPAEATFRFATRLDDPSMIWLEWRDGVYVPFALPAVGETVTLPPVTLPF